MQAYVHASEMSKNFAQLATKWNEIHVAVVKMKQMRDDIPHFMIMCPAYTQ